MLPLSNFLPSPPSHTLVSKHCMRKTLTFVLLRELPEAVPFILQYCSASLAMSEINFWEAREIRRILKNYKKYIYYCRGFHCQNTDSMPLPFMGKKINKSDQEFLGSHFHFSITRYHYRNKKGDTWSKRLKGLRHANGD